jgi:hypothetical protein
LPMMVVNVNKTTNVPPGKVRRRNQDTGRRGLFLT